jgi:hypothetical protein
MVAIRLGIHPDEGVDRLRAYSYASGRRISSVAADIIARRMTFAFLWKCDECLGREVCGDLSWG